MLGKEKAVVADQLTANVDNLTKTRDKLREIERKYKLLPEVPSYMKPVSPGQVKAEPIETIDVEMSKQSPRVPDERPTIIDLDIEPEITENKDSCQTFT
jgi:hypothetical protein